MQSMEEAVLAMRERERESKSSEEQTEESLRKTAKQYRTKLLAEYTDYTCVDGGGGWGAWLCPF